MHHGIATAIASDLLNRRRHRKEFPGWEASLAIVHCKRHRNRNRIVTATHCLLESGQACGHHSQLFNVGGHTMKPSTNRGIKFWPRKRIAGFNRRSSPRDGALRKGRHERLDILPCCMSSIEPIGADTSPRGSRRWLMRTLCFIFQFLHVPSLEEGKRPPPPRQDSASGLY